MSFNVDGKLRVLAFDCVNTVFDVSTLPHGEIKDYIDQTKRPQWAPLKLSPQWRECLAHADSASGLARLAHEGYVTVTCSNLPAWLLGVLSSKNGIDWSAIVPFEGMCVYKPHPDAYLNVARVCNVTPHEVLMVTANEDAPDLKTAHNLGMQTVLIDRAGKYNGDLPRTIIELAERLGA